MKIIVGLGNPGPKYETTRHNVGFLAVDRLADRWKADAPQTKYEGEIQGASFGGEKVLLVKPQTFMNLSGQTVGPLAQFYKVPQEDIVVIHDEMDLPPETFRIKVGGNPAGHNGLKSINECVGREKLDYYRIRIGIGKGNTSHVLGQFSDAELGWLDPMLDEVADAIEMIVRNDAKTAMNQFNRKKKKPSEEEKEEE